MLYGSRNEKVKHTHLLQLKQDFLDNHQKKFYFLQNYYVTILTNAEYYNACSNLQQHKSNDCSLTFFFRRTSPAFFEKKWNHSFMNKCQHVTFSSCSIFTRSLVRIPEAAELVNICFA